MKRDRTWIYKGIVPGTSWYYLSVCRASHRSQPENIRVSQRPPCSTVGGLIQRQPWPRPAVGGGYLEEPVEIRVQPTHQEKTAVSTCFYIGFYMLLHLIFASIAATTSADICFSPFLTTAAWFDPSLVGLTKDPVSHPVQQNTRLQDLQTALDAFLLTVAEGEVRR